MSATTRATRLTTFETFPFPEGLTPDIPADAYADDPRAQRIAAAARRLNELREAWLNPPDLVERVPEVVPGYPDRLLPVDEERAGSEEAHPHQPLQRAPHLARQRPPGARRGGRRRLRLAGRPALTRSWSACSS